MKHYLAKFFFAPLIVILMYAIFFQEVLVGVVSKSFAYNDEVLLVLALLLMFFPLNRDTGYVKMVFGSLIMVVIFFAASFNSYSFRSELTIFTQILMHFKSFFLFLLLYNFKEYINTRLILHSFLLLTIIGVAFNVLLGEQFNALIKADISFRFGMVRPVGIQASTMNLGVTFAFFYLFYMFYKPVQNYVKSLPMTLSFAFICLFSSLRTPFVALIVSFMFVFGASWKKVILGVVVLAMLMPFFLT